MRYGCVKADKAYHVIDNENEFHRGPHVVIEVVHLKTAEGIATMLNKAHEQREKDKIRKEIAKLRKAL